MKNKDEKELNPITSFEGNAGYDRYVTKSTTGQSTSVRTTSEALHLREVPKDPIDLPKEKHVDDDNTNRFTVTFDNDTNIIEMIVNGETYRSFNCKDGLSGSIKFHDALDAMLKKFSDWKFYERN